MGGLYMRQAQQDQRLSPTRKSVLYKLIITVVRAVLIVGGMIMISTYTKPIFPQAPFVVQNVVHALWAHTAAFVIDPAFAMIWKIASVYVRVKFDNSSYSIQLKKNL